MRIRISVLNSLMGCALFLLSSISVAQSGADTRPSVILCFNEINQILKDLNLPPLSETKWAFKRHGATKTYAQIKADSGTRNNEVEDRIQLLWKKSEEYGKKIMDLEAKLKHPVDGKKDVSLENAILLAHSSCPRGDCHPTVQEIINKHKPNLNAVKDGEKQVRDEIRELAYAKSSVDWKLEEISKRPFDLTITRNINPEASNDINEAVKKEWEYNSERHTLWDKISKLRAHHRTAQNLHDALAARNTKTDADLKDIERLAIDLKAWGPELRAMEEKHDALGVRRVAATAVVERRKEDLTKPGAIYLSYGNSEIIVSIEGGRFAMNLKNCNIAEVGSTENPNKMTGYNSIADLCIKRQDKFCKPHVVGFCQEHSQMKDLDDNAKKECKKILDSISPIKQDAAS